MAHITTTKLAKGAGTQCQTTTFPLKDLCQQKVWGVGWFTARHIPTHSFVTLLPEAHDRIPKPSEDATLQWLRQEISDHVFCATKSDLNISRVHSISNEKEAYVNMTGPLFRRNYPICLQQYCCLIVLVQQCVFDVIPLMSQERTRPNGLAQSLGTSHYLPFSRTGGVQVLCTRPSIYSAASQSP